MKKFFIFFLVTLLMTINSNAVQAFQTNKIKSGSQPASNQADTLTPEEMHFEMTSMDIDDVDGSPAIKIYVDFNWNSDPFWTLTDTITVSWSSGWRISTSYLEVTHLLSNGTEKIKTITPVEQMQNHIIWDYDLQKAADVYGRAIIVLVPEDPKKISPTSFSSADVQYAHEARTITLKPVTFTSTRSVSWNNADILD